MATDDTGTQYRDKKDSLTSKVCNEYCTLKVQQCIICEDEYFSREK